jgi:hypothetical protein
MESVEKRIMNISWVLADNTVLDPTLDITNLKDIGPIWGSWKTWRGCGTDNVVCHDQGRAVELIKREFQNSCNFYIHNDAYQFLNSPPNVKLYQGQFPDQIDNPDEIISMHLAASQNDILLLMGFCWIKQSKSTDRLQEHRAHVYRTLVENTILNNPDVQWVLVDHTPDLWPNLEKIENLTQDTFPNIVKMLAS